MAEELLPPTIPKSLVIKRRESFKDSLKNKIEFIRQDEQIYFFELIKEKWKNNILDQICHDFYNNDTFCTNYKKIHNWIISKIYFSFWDKLPSNVKYNASIFISEKSINNNPEIIIIREKPQSENSYFWKHSKHGYSNYFDYLQNNQNIFKHIKEEFVSFNANELNIWKIQINENNNKILYLSILLDKDIPNTSLSIGFISNKTKLNFAYKNVGMCSIDDDLQKVSNYNVVYIPIYDDYADCKIILENLTNPAKHLQEPTFIGLF
jgi:hypothetical protein